MLWTVFEGLRHRKMPAFKCRTKAHPVIAEAPCRVDKTSPQYSKEPIMYFLVAISDWEDTQCNVDPGK
jgi:hypothetical protein